jgi:outer membrane protein
MKKIITAVAAILLLTSTFVNAQKIAHINSNDLMLLMPERKSAEESLQNFAKELEKQMGTMNQEYESKVQEYQSKESLMTDIIKQDKVKEITDLENRIKTFQQTAQESLQKKEQELLAPMLDKAKKAIGDVAKEAGYRYVLDTAAGAVLYSEPSDDIMPLVKKKLGIDAAAVPPSQQKTPATEGKPKEQPKK